MTSNDIKSTVGNWDTKSISDKKEYAEHIKYLTREYLLELGKFLKKEKNYTEKKEEKILEFLNLEELEHWDQDEWIKNKNNLVDPRIPLYMLCRRVYDYTNNNVFTSAKKETEMQEIRRILSRAQQAMIQEHIIIKN